MASKHTEHYGLSLWEPGDKFLRQEFNGDHERVDQALHVAERLAARSDSALLEVRYQLYQLILQNEYEGRETRWKKALVNDCFLDASGVARLSDGLLIAQGAVTLERTGQGDLALGYGSADGTSAELYPRTVRSGRLTGFACKLYNNASQRRSTSVKYTLTVNGAVRTTGYSSSVTAGAYADASVEVTLPTPVLLTALDRFGLSVESGASDWKFYLDSSGRGVGGALYFTPVAGTAGELTAVPRALPACGEMLGWVRHSGGTVALAVDGVATERTEQRETVNLQGEPCRETVFRLDGSWAAGDRVFTLAVSLGDGEQKAQVWDYGVVLI